MTPSSSEVEVRLELQRIATHVLARARFAGDGRFGLRVTASGIATPAFGPDGEVLRVAGGTLVRERRVDGNAVSETMALSGSSLAELAAFAGVDLDPPFEAGADSPEVGDPARPIDLDPTLLHGILTWYRIGAEALDRILPRTGGPSVVQLWPEHFDVGFDGSTGSGRANFGASPGDGAYAEPYLYVGPWETARPGDAAYWNADFGAVATRSDLGEDLGADPVGSVVAFFEQGLRQLG